MESTNILQEVYGEEKEEDMVQPKLGEEWDPPPSPPKDDSNTKTKNSPIMHEHVIIDSDLYSDESDDHMPIIDIVAPNNNFDDNEECVLDMLYDNALDDGPILLDNPLCLEIVTHSCEEKIDTLAVHDNTLISKSPILLLNSSSFTIDEKYELARKCIGGLHLPLLQNSYGNHAIKIENSTSNYFERGKHVNECQGNYNDPL